MYILTGINQVKQVFPLHLDVQKRFLYNQGSENAQEEKLENEFTFGKISGSMKIFCIQH